MDSAAEIAVLKEKLRARVPVNEGPGCLLCQWALEDLERHGTLTNKHPEPSNDGKPVYPIEGKMKHLVLEGFLREPAKPNPVDKK